MVRLTATARATEAMEDDKKKKRAGQTQTKGRLTVYLPTSAETATSISQLGGPPVCCGSERLPGDAAPGARGKGKGLVSFSVSRFGVAWRHPPSYSVQWVALPRRGAALISKTSRHWEKHKRLRVQSPSYLRFALRGVGFSPTGAPRTPTTCWTFEKVVFWSFAQSLRWVPYSCSS